MGYNPFPTYYNTGASLKTQFPHAPQFPVFNAPKVSFENARVGTTVANALTSCPVTSSSAKPTLVDTFSFLSSNQQPPLNISTSSSNKPQPSVASLFQTNNNQTPNTFPNVPTTSST